MKRILSISLIMIMTLMLCLTGCSGGDERESELNEFLEDTNSALAETFSSDSTEFHMIEEYLNSWAKNNDLNIVKTSEHYMVINNPATEAGKKGPSLALLCPINPSKMSESNQQLSIGLTALLGPADHGDISLIITETTSGGYLGSLEIDKKYLAADNLIDLEYETKTGLKTSGVYSFDSTMTRKLSRNEPSYSNAYTITMTVESYTDSYDFGNKTPNPINTIGSYLASNQSSGKLFELASFSSKSTVSNTPYSATATIVIDDNNVESMKSRFEKSFENAKDKCDKLEIDFVYTMTETDLPEKVLSNSDKSSIISLIYTIDPGIYAQEEESGDILSADDILAISTSGDSLKMKLNARAVDKTSLEEIDQTLAITAGLSDVKYSSDESHLTWHSNKDMAEFFTDALSITDEDYVFTTIKTSDLNIISAKNPDINCIKLGCSDASASATMLNCIHFMKHIIGMDEEDK